MQTKTCEKCGSELTLLHGCGFDNDIYTCDNRHCDYELELDESTYPYRFEAIENRENKNIIDIIEITTGITFCQCPKKYFKFVIKQMNKE